MTRLDELQAELDAAEADALAVALTPEEAKEAAIVARIAEARQTKILADRARRGLDAAAREKAARKVAGGRYSVLAVDIADMVPQLDPKTLPGAGVLVVREPPKTPVDAYAAFLAGVEGKTESHPTLFAAIIGASTIDPDPMSGGEGVKLSSFLDAHGGACVTLGSIVAELGGQRRKAEKRGSA